MHAHVTQNLSLLARSSLPPILFHGVVTPPCCEAAIVYTFQDWEARDRKITITEAICSHEVLHLQVGAVRHVLAARL